MPSEVSIVNQALTKLGDDPILSLADDSKRARLALLSYPDTRDAVLRAHAWNFAIRRAQLGQLSDAPAFGFAYQYQLPSDPYCLRVLSLADSRQTFTVEGRALLTNTPTAFVRYLARVTDPAQFDALYVECLSARLAGELAYPLTAQAELVKAMFDLYAAKLQEAQARDAAEGTTQPYQEEVFPGLELCQQALGELGLEAALASDDSHQAGRLCRALYDATRRAVLRAHPWNCAIRRTTFTPTTAPAYGYAHAYSLPADGLRVLELEDARDVFQVEGRTLLTDQGAPLKARYVADVTDPALFDPLFADALTARLAARLALPLTGNAGLAERAWALYERRLAEARAMDGLEGTPPVLESHDLLEVR